MVKYLFVLALLLTIGCSENSKARQGGGTMKITLPAGQKLTNATWKDNDLWYLTRKMREGEHAEVSTFKEKSQFGYLEGTVVFTERED